MFLVPSDLRRPIHIVFIDFDDTHNSLLNAGQAKSTLEVGKRLVSQGYRVTVISSRYPGFQDRQEEGLTYIHIGLASKWIRLNNLAYIAALPFIVSRLKADLILECFTPPCSTLLTPLMTRIPVVAKSTSFEADRFSRTYHLPFSLIETLGCRLYRYFIPASAYTDNKMRRLNPSVISQIIPEGVGEECFSVKRRTPRYLLFLARLDMGQKGIDLLLQAYQSISHRILYPLIIAGHGPDKEAILAKITQLGLGDKVSLIGPAYGEKKARILSKAVGVVIPSRYEGFCLFALEALAAGVPIVTFDIPGLSWAKSRVALKAKAFNVEEYAQKLLDICVPAFSQHMGKAARRFARHYTWEAVALQYDKFFQAIIGDQVYQKQETLAARTTGRGKLVLKM